MKSLGFGQGLGMRLPHRRVRVQGSEMRVLDAWKCQKMVLAWGPLQ